MSEAEPDIPVDQVKDKLTTVEEESLHVWENNSHYTLQRIADEVECSDATVSTAIKLYGWLVDEDRWLSRDWKGEPEEIKRDAVARKLGVTVSDSQEEQDKQENTHSSNKQSRQRSWVVGPELEEIDGMEQLQRRISNATTVNDWSMILIDYMNWGNNSKVHNSIGIFSLTSAHDCVNRFTGNCQVGGDECYAVVDEKRYDYVLDYTRRQEYFWDCISAEMFAKAFIQAAQRRSNITRGLKFNQHGDFRHQQDIYKVNRIAELLDEHNYKVFTYSASNYLDWSQATSDNLVVNQSNEIEDYGTRRYLTVDTPEEIPEDTVWCPYDRQAYEGVDNDERTKCGECMLCVNKGCGDIAVVK